MIFFLQSHCVDFFCEERDVSIPSLHSRCPQHTTLSLDPQDDSDDLSIFLSFVLLIPLSRNKDQSFTTTLSTKRRPPSFTHTGRTLLAASCFATEATRTVRHASAFSRKTARACLHGGVAGLLFRLQVDLPQLVTTTNNNNNFQRLCLTNRKLRTRQ